MSGIAEDVAALERENAHLRGMLDARPTRWSPRVVAAAAVLATFAVIGTTSGLLLGARLGRLHPAHCECALAPHGFPIHGAPCSVPPSQ